MKTGSSKIVLKIKDLLTGTKVNILANFAGKGWEALLSVIVLPLYIRFLGVESFGLIGVYFSLQTMFALFGVGMVSTINREMARSTSEPTDITIENSRDLLFTLEILCIFIALMVGLSVYLLATPLTQHWLNGKNLSSKSVRDAIVLIGFTMAVQWPIPFYDGGMMGLQKQVKLNFIRVIMSTVRRVVAVILLWKISPTIHCFFSWQLTFGFIHTIVMSIILRRSLPSLKRLPHFRWFYIRQTWRFMTGVSTVSLLGVVLRQLDKIILSRMLNLEMFGFYMLANTLAGYAGQLVMPIYLSVFPKFSSIIAACQAESLMKTVYHKSCQLVATLVIPLTLIVSLFSKEVLQALHMQPEVIENTFAILTLLVIARSLNSLMRIPYGLHLAYGSVDTALKNNFYSLIAFAPMIFFMTYYYGAIGAAFAPVVVNLFKLHFFMLYTHRKFLRGELKYWAIHDFFLPLSVAMTVVGLFRFVYPAGLPPLSNLFLLGFLGVITIIVTSFVSKDLLGSIRENLHRISLAV